MAIPSTDSVAGVVGSLKNSEWSGQLSYWTWEIRADAYLGEQLRSFNQKEEKLRLLGALQYVVHATFMIDGKDLFIYSELVISFFINPNKKGIYSFL